MPLDSTSSSLPDSPSPTSAPNAESSTAATFNDSIWRPIISCGGALGLSVLLASATVRPATPVGNGNTSPEIILPSETTMIVTASAPPGKLLRGEIRLVADVVGKAPISGAVARQLVEPGTRVKQGDPVMEISSGDSVRPAPAAENLQERAEQSQIAASDAQSALAQKINIAQSKLRGAQERVERAQSQVGAARDIVRRLQNGEAVSSSEIPAPFRSAGAPVPPKPRPTKAEPSVNREGEIALQQAQAAREAAEQGNRGLKTARQMLADAQKAARDAASKLEASTKKVAEVEAQFDAKKASGSDVEVARADERDAKSVAAAAERAVATAKTEVSKREKAAAALQKYADKAAGDAKAALKSARLFEQENAKDKDEADKAPSAPDNGLVTLEQAIKFAGATLEESRRATLEAERLHGEIEGYKHQVSTSSARVEESTQQLAAAQQKVLDSVPRPRFSTAVAPAEGVVTWVSRLAREVRAGESIFGIARGQKVGARFEVKDELWRSIKPGAILPAVAVQNATPATGTSTTTSVNAAASQTPVEVVVTEVDTSEGSTAATVEAEVRTPKAGVSAPLGEGTQLLASVAVPGQKKSITVPVSALVGSGSKQFVAILSPAEESSSPGETASEEDKNPSFHLEWKPVKLGRSDGLRSEIMGGLQVGERIVASPDHLQDMGFFPEPEAIRGVGDAHLPQEVSAGEVLVRLTSSSTLEQTA